jgi:hypothetical protein
MEALLPGRCKGLLHCCSDLIGFVSRNGDYCTANTVEARKYLKTYGLTPPAVESFEAQAERCLKLLAMKPTPIEKFQYLTHLRATNVHLFYRLYAEHVKVDPPASL